MSKSKWPYGTKVHITKELVLKELNQFIEDKNYFHEFKNFYELWELDDEDNVTLEDSCIEIFFYGLSGHLVDIDIDTKSYSFEILNTCRYLLETGQITRENMEAAVMYDYIHKYVDKLESGVITEEIMRNHLQKRIDPYDNELYEKVMAIYENRLFHQFWNFA